MFKFVFLNWNAAELYVSLIKKIISWDFTPMDYLLIDNDSQEEDKAIIKQNLPNEKTIFSTSNVGYAAGLNVGIQHFITQKDIFLIFVNPDVEIEENNIKILLEKAKDLGSKCILSPALLETKHTKTSYHLGGRDYSKYHITRHVIDEKKWQNMHKNTLLSVDYTPGTFLIVHIDIFKKVGLLNEKYFIYGEWPDWCFRAKKMNYTPMVCPQATVIHARENTQQYTRKLLNLYYTVRNRLLYLHLNSPPNFRIKKYYWLAFFRLKWLKNTLFFSTDKSKTILKAIKDARILTQN
ncbi:MAG: glycosyltransferase family 2 protein [Chitinophagales bacterium]|nr:glycosyltransferase family 2 protein [Bacteroidota bacterium]MCB9042644.1 glycosyltransferase family 2 protein [Chitinophagales bacterium]